MNYTKNYHLPQWVKEDRIMMEDFNAMNSSIENGLTQTAAQAGTAVSTANTAKQTADTAQTMAQQITSAAYTPSNKPYKVGSYTGSNQTTAVHLGFRPSFVIVTGAGVHGPSEPAAAFSYIGMTAGNLFQSQLTFTDTGFEVYPTSQTKYAPILGEAGHVYEYIAFK